MTPNWAATDRAGAGTGSADVCEYCGCRGVPPIAELMDEHTTLVDHAHHVRQDLASENPSAAMSRLSGHVAHLDRHVQREEDGIFRAMRATGEFLDEINALEGEHRGFAIAVAALDPESSGFDAQVIRSSTSWMSMSSARTLGIFPVSVVTLGATGWTIVDEAHTNSPSFLHNQATSGVTADTHPS